MLIIKKKQLLNELAVSLYLMLEYNPDTTNFATTQRIQERAKAALESAQYYTGTINYQNVRVFLTTEPLHFCIDCRKDIIKGDIIRFIEHVQDNRRRPPRYLGKRGITAEVIGITPNGNNPMLQLRVMASGGVWDQAPNSEISRTMKLVNRSDVMRAPWEDEEKRNALRQAITQKPPTMKSAKAQLLKRTGKSKTN
jgi:hypothetical protein